MNHLYLVRLFRHHKIIGTLVGGFCAITLLMNLMGDQVSPFLLWAMFSKEESPKAVYEVPRIIADGEQIKYSRQLWDANRHMLRSPMLKYAAMRANGDRDVDRSFLEEKLGQHYTKIRPFHESITNSQSQYPDFEAWVKRYLSSSIGRPVNHLEVFIDRYRYTAEGRPAFINSTLLFEE